MAHKTGVNVNATKPEITMELAIVMENSRYNTPTGPDINVTGMKTDVITKVMAMIAPLISKYFFYGCIG